MRFRFLTGVTALILGVSAHATPTVNGFDLSTFNFDVATYNVGSDPQGIGGDATASGTSNGINWSISPTSLWSVRTTTNGSFAFSSLPLTTDNLHPSGDYTITFARPIDTLIVALSNDNTTDSINFGLVPSFLQGVTASGTQIVLNSPSGGLAWFTNVNSLSISNTNNNGITDGYDLAFHAIAAVPEPSQFLLMLTGGVILLCYLHRRRVSV
jgi:hypothetical protein